MTDLGNSLRDGACVFDLHAADMASVCGQLLDALIDAHAIDPSMRPTVASALAEREAQGTTAIGSGVAVPHAYVDGIERVVTAFARLEPPAELGALDGRPTTFVFLSIGPTGHADEHLQRLSSIARLLGNDDARAGLARASTRGAVLQTVAITRV